MSAGQVSGRAPHRRVMPPPGPKLEIQTWPSPSIDTAQAPQMLPVGLNGDPGAGLPPNRSIDTLPRPG